MGLILNGVDVKVVYGFVTKSVTGRGLPPLEHITIEMPLVDGAIYRASRVAPRQLQIVGYVFGKTPEEARTKRDNFLNMIATAATGEVTLTFPDTMRSIKVRLASSGADFVPLGPVYNAYAYQITLNFIAFDPYFYSNNQRYLTG